MRARHAFVIGTAVIGTALAALAGCSSAETATPAAPEPAAQDASAAAAAAAPAPSESAPIDAGTMEATSAYLTALGKVDHKLVADTQTALDNGAQICIDIDERKPAAEQEKNIVTRFAVDAAAAKQILALTKANLCLQ